MKVPSRALLLASLCVLLVCLRTTRAACDTIANCDDCADGKCSKCATGFTLSTDGTACSAATTPSNPNCEVSGCETCEAGDPKKCNTCACGHVLSSFKDMCSACRIEFCESCESPGYGNRCSACRKNYKAKDGGTKCVYAKPGLEWWWIVFIVFVIVLVGLLTAYLVYSFFFRDVNPELDKEKLSALDDRTGGRSGYGDQSHNRSYRDGELSVDSDAEIQSFSIDEHPIGAEAPSTSNPLVPVSLGQGSISSHRVNEDGNSDQRPVSSGSRFGSRNRSWALGNEDSDNDDGGRFF